MNENPAYAGFSCDMHFLSFPYLIWRETTNDFLSISCSSKNISLYTVTEGLGTKWFSQLLKFHTYYLTYSLFKCIGLTSYLFPTFPCSTLCVCVRVWGEIQTTDILSIRIYTHTQYSAVSSVGAIADCRESDMSRPPQSLSGAMEHKLVWTSDIRSEK